MRQLCPHCFQTVELPETAAGTDAPCPSCGKAFAVPKAYTPAVDPGAVKSSAGQPVPSPTLPEPAAPPPGYAPSPTDTVKPPPPPGYNVPTYNPTVLDGGYSNAASIAVPSSIFLYAAPIGFALILLLTLFPWVGAYPGGNTAYTQSFWGALTNGLGVDLVAQDVIRKEAELLKALRSDWWILLPYLLLVLFGAALAWADRFIDDPEFAYKLGYFGTVRALVWPKRGLVLLIVAVATLALFTMESLRGFGLEAAVKSVAAAKFKEEADKADNTADKQKIRIREGVEIAQFGLGGTTAYWAVAGLHCIIVIGVLGRMWRISRPAQAPPLRLKAEW